MNADVAPDPRRWKALAVLSVAYLMVILDVSVTNVALPSIHAALDFSAADLQWVVSGYALTFGGFLLLGGRAGDILGRRRFFMVGLVAFVAFSLLCGLSTSSTMLIVARFLQGMAGAILSPSVFSIVSVTFAEGSERNTALGILGAIAGSGAAIGVLLGGVLTEYAGWEWIFFINAPIGVAALLLVPRYVRESRANGMMRHFDAAGAVTITASLMLLVCGLTQSTNLGWGSVQVIGALIGFAVLLAVFLLVESRSRAPLVPLSFFRRHRTPTGANVVGFGLGTAIFGMFYLLSLYMQDVLGYSPVQTGVAYLALALTSVAAAGLSQALVTRVGVKPVLAMGLAFLGLALAYLTGISVGGSYLEDLFPAFIVIGSASGSRSSRSQSPPSPASPTPRPGSRPGSSTRRSRSAARSASPSSSRWPRTAPTACSRAGHRGRRRSPTASASASGSPSRSRPSRCWQRCSSSGAATSRRSTPGVRRAR